MTPSISKLTPRIVDFPDRLSPMLVKELRQGLRTRVFTSVFILIQIGLIIVSLISTSEASNGEDLSEFSGLFWSLFGFSLLVILPLRGFSALANEIQNGSLETISLTHLSAWRIVYGKWLALFSQTVLICLSIIPYMILRYFLGKVDLVSELFQFTFLLLLSGLSTAVVVGVSSMKNVFLRLAIIGTPAIIGSMFLLRSMMFFYYYNSTRSSSFGAFDDLWVIVLVFCIGILFATYYALDMGATYIASQADNYSTRKRLIGLSTVLLIYCLIWFSQAPYYFPFGISMLLLTLLAFDALTEKTTLVPSVYAPFLRRGRIGKALALVFAPGWTHGTFFVLVCAALAILGTVSVTGIKVDRPEFAGYASLATIVASLVWPSAIISFVKPERRTVALYIATLLGIAAVSLICVRGGFNHGDTSLLISLVPLGSFTLIMENITKNVADADTDMRVVFASGMLMLSCFLSFLISGTQGMRHFRRACRIYTDFEKKHQPISGEIGVNHESDDH